MNVAEEVNRYVAMPYRIELIQEEDGYFVSIPELPGCMSQGTTAEEALEMIRDAQRLWLQVAIEDGISVPIPTALQHNFSGKFNVRVPRELHRHLVFEAEREGVSLNQLVNNILARAGGGRARRTTHDARRT